MIDRTWCGGQRKSALSTATSSSQRCACGAAKRGRLAPKCEPFVVPEAFAHPAGINAVACA
jgi:hypothetical protein